MKDSFNLQLAYVLWYLRLRGYAAFSGGGAAPPHGVSLQDLYRFAFESRKFLFQENVGNAIE